MTNNGYTGRPAHNEYTGRLTPDEIELIKKEFKNSGISLDRLKTWLGERGFSTSASTLSRVYSGDEEMKPVFGVAAYQVTQNPELMIIEHRYGTPRAREMLGIEAAAPTGKVPDEFAKVFYQKRLTLDRALEQQYNAGTTYVGKAKVIDTIDELITRVSVNE